MPPRVNRGVTFPGMREDKGRRLRAILALGSQDVGDAGTLIPVDPGVEVVGCTSDHTIVDVTDSGRNWKSGDTLTFQTRYAHMLYAFTGNHVDVVYQYDRKEEGSCILARTVRSMPAGRKTMIECRRTVRFAMKS